MAVTNTEHPPSASLAFGFVTNEWDYKTILCVILGVILLSLVRMLTKPLMRNLL
jgi:hypothetical protein